MMIVDSGQDKEAEEEEEWVENCNYRIRRPSSPPFLIRICREDQDNDKILLLLVGKWYNFEPINRI